MIQHLLVPTDFSKGASVAVAYAAQLARYLQADLTLCHIYHLSAIPGINAPPAHYMAEVEADVKAEAMAQLANLAADHEQPGLTIHLEARPGVAAETILALATERPTDLIVMGTKGKTRLETWVFGSVVSEVMERAPCPLLAVPEGAPLHPLAHLTFATSLDGRDADALAHLHELALPFGAKVSSLHISTEAGQAQAAAALRKGGSQYLLVAEGGSSLEILVDDQAANHLDDYLLKLQTDLLAVVYRDRTALEEWLSPSHTKYLLARTKVPLLVFKKK
jgi:nucleotide-binding universal stress UspA family protein